MELVNDFTVKAPIDEAYATLTDVERIAPCLPGAQLTEVEGDTYRGLVKVKVGPITAQFKGQASFVERDAEQHRAVLKAEGRDTGGKGNASALITAQLEEVDAEMTKVTVSTDLTITGKVAQFGRGALADVSEKLLRQFVTNLETTVLTNGDPSGSGPAETNPGEAAPADSSPSETSRTAAAPKAVGAAPAATEPGVRKVESAPVEPIDLLETAGAPMLKRLAPLIGGVIVLLVVWRLVRRRR
jgi:carbon monoxide dehydrogenase subunit G